MGRRAQVLVVYKKDAFRQYVQEQRDARLMRLLRERHPDVLDMQRAHVVHEDALQAVVLALRRLDVDVDLAYRRNLNIGKRYNLVIPVGGDGTFLHAAHARIRAPLLGVNSDPARSEAVFCAATSRTIGRLCQQALAGRLRVLRLHQLELWLNGRRLAPRAVNDVLVVHDDPATMSRYRLRIRTGSGVREEFQKSSGLWVATAAGSSSAVRAAGGHRLPWSAARFQYRPRELYRGRLSSYRLTGGVLPWQRRVRVTWLMRRGAAFVDGPHVKIPLRFGDQLELRLSASNPVCVLGLALGHR